MRLVGDVTTARLYGRPRLEDDLDDSVRIWTDPHLHDRHAMLAIVHARRGLLPDQDKPPRVLVAVPVGTDSRSRRVSRFTTGRDGVLAEEPSAGPSARLNSGRWVLHASLQRRAWRAGVR